MSELEAGGPLRVVNVVACRTVSSDVSHSRMFLHEVRGNVQFPQFPARIDVELWVTAVGDAGARARLIPVLLDEGGSVLSRRDAGEARIRTRRVDGFVVPWPRVEFKTPGVYYFSVVREDEIEDDDKRLGSPRCPVDVQPAPPRATPPT